MFPSLFSEENSSDDWEKLSSGSKSPRKQSKDGEVNYFHEKIKKKLNSDDFLSCRMRIGFKPKLKSKNSAVILSEDDYVKISRRFLCRNLFMQKEMNTSI